MEEMREQSKMALLRTLLQFGWDAESGTSRKLRGNRERVSVTAYVAEKLVGLYCTLWTRAGTLMQVSTEDINGPISWFGELPPTPTEAKALVDDRRRGRLRMVQKRVLGA